MLSERPRKVILSVASSPPFGTCVRSTNGRRLTLSAARGSGAHCQSARLVPPRRNVGKCGARRTRIRDGASPGHALPGVPPSGQLCAFNRTPRNRQSQRVWVTVARAFSARAYPDASVLVRQLRSDVRRKLDRRKSTSTRRAATLSSLCALLVVCGVSGHWAAGAVAFVTILIEMWSMWTPDQTECLMYAPSMWFADHMDCPGWQNEPKHRKTKERLSDKTKKRTHKPEVSARESFQADEKDEKSPIPKISSPPKLPRRSFDLSVDVTEEPPFPLQRIQSGGSRVSKTSTISDGSETK
eukprot:603678_1